MESAEIKSVETTKRKHDEIESDSNEHLDLGHLNHTLDDSDYSTDCSICQTNKERKKLKRTKEQSDHEDEQNLTVTENNPDGVLSTKEVKLLSIFSLNILI